MEQGESLDKAAAISSLRGGADFLHIKPASIRALFWWCFSGLFSGPGKVGKLVKDPAVPVVCSICQDKPTIGPMSRGEPITPGQWRSTTMHDDERRFRAVPFLLVIDD
ncbi:hypothetical protein N3K66_002214 [Trichothecium roseum]|uniref:Uncharacterized protein n=1 Tax=Trichothecium roseum TaxID=47278 RepID=A0ACC0V8X0_9HYPO|nr:hypothetical protein N3K66_002214 [Trichothecium roseum]